jgi:signal transduction histidine kinase
MIRPVRGSLLFRLYVVGVVQLLLVAVAALVIGTVISRFSVRWDLRQVIDHVRPLVERPEALASELRSLRDSQHVSLSLYDAEGSVVASNVDPPLKPPRWGGPFGSGFRSAHEPPPPHDRPPPDAPPPFGGPPPFGMPFGGPPPPEGRPPPSLEAFTSMEIHGATGVLVTRFDPPRPSRVPPILTFVSGLIVVGVGALLTARWIALPLEQVSRTARSLGEGNLRARTELEEAGILGELGQAFDEMADRIQRLLLAEKELLANVSHELRTPLARIRVALDIAAEGDMEVARASLSEIAVDLTELEALLADVLDATRLELQDEKGRAAGFALHVEALAPETLATLASERFRSRHAGRPLEVSSGEGLPPIRVDPVLFRRVLDNLLENADKYTPDPASPIVLGVSVQQARVQFEVRDHGIGIAKDDLPRVFMAFFRGDRSRSRGTGGVGLGLTLAKRIVEAHDGTIVVTSDAEMGTTVRVTVPTSPPAA